MNLPAVSPDLVLVVGCWLLAIYVGHIPWLSLLLLRLNFRRENGVRLVVVDVLFK
jgi:hypothetical protein